MINKVYICGLLTEEPIHNKNYTRFYLRITEDYVNKDGDNKTVTINHPITLCGRSAESFCNEAKKGNTILIEGKLVMYQFFDAEERVEVKEYRTFGHHFTIIK